VRKEPEEAEQAGRGKRGCRIYNVGCRMKKPEGSEASYRKYSKPAGR
jgi:hypothetical protein